MLASSIMENYKSDRLIEFIRQKLATAFELRMAESEWFLIIKSVEKMLNDYYLDPFNSDLAVSFPNLLTGSLFTKLDLTRSFERYNKKYHLTSRKFVQPSFDEIRHILNSAQVFESVKHLKLITFDGDETLYKDGQFFADNNLAIYISSLLQKNIKICLVTAAGYGIETDKYENRLQGLLQYFASINLAKEYASNFYVMGGESNYFMKLNEFQKLIPIEKDIWYKSNIDTELYQSLLDVSEKQLQNLVSEFSLRAKIIRKPLAIGMVAGGYCLKTLVPIGSGSNIIKKEILDEAVFRIKNEITLNPIFNNIPYCAFNGGNDIWVDCGDKKLGIELLQGYLNIKPSECLHVGDQFFKTGNDFKTRHISTCVWVLSPKETKSILRHLLSELGEILDFRNEDRNENMSGTALNNDTNRIKKNGIKTKIHRNESGNLFVSISGSNTNMQKNENVVAAVNAVTSKIETDNDISQTSSENTLTQDNSKQINSIYKTEDKNENVNSQSVTYYDYDMKWSSKYVNGCIFDPLDAENLENNSELNVALKVPVKPQTSNSILSGSPSYNNLNPNALSISFRNTNLMHDTNEKNATQTIILSPSKMNCETFSSDSDS